MIYQKIKEIEPKKFDVIIIGSGPAGISLAIGLEKKKINCLIVEAGGQEFKKESQKFYEGTIRGEWPRDISIARLRMLGGTSNHWGRTCRTLDDYDFLKWPIKKNNLDNYIETSSEILGIKPLFRSQKISNKLKLIEFQISSVGSVGKKYYKQIKQSKYINLILNTAVIKLNGAEGIVKNIDCINDNSNFKLVADTYVLATGGIENSRLLLWSRIKNDSLINKSLPIGNYFFEHPLKILGKAVIDKKKTKSLLKNNLNKFENFLNYGENSITYNFAPTQYLMEQSNIFNSCIWMTLHERSNKNYKNLLKNLLCIAPNLSTDFLKMFDKNLLCGTTLTSSWEQDGEFNNQIKLNNNIDSLGVPKVTINYSKSEKTRKTARVCIEEIGKFCIDNNLGRVAGHDFLFNEDLYMSIAGWHHLGGTIMGTSYKDSVVNKNLNVHDCKNLFITGSSVFPSGGHANPTFTIVQLSLRLSEYLYRNKINS